MSGVVYFDQLLGSARTQKLVETFISTSGVPSVNRTDLQALILVGPTDTSPVLDPLAVLLLDNRLCMIEGGERGIPKFS